MTLLSIVSLIPDPAGQLATDGAVVRWVLAAVTASLLGVVVWLMRLATDKDKLYVESLRDWQKQAGELTRETVKAMHDLSDAGREAAAAIVRRIDEHGERLGTKIDTNHREVLDRLPRKGNANE